ncbi:MAG: phage tail length tape measure family protein, partial [Vicinamibacterales bacterium]
MTQIADLIGRFQDNVSAGANAAAASVERLAKATERATEALERDDQVIKRAGASYDSVVRRIDGAAAAKAREEAATRKFEAAQEAVNRQLERQTITAKQAADQIARLAAVRDQDIAKANAAGAAIEGRFTASSAAIVRTSGASQMALRNLGIQSIDVFQQLASGAPIMMTMVQQGGQVAQMAAVTGTSLTSLARSAASVLAGYLPLIGVLAGAAGVAAGLFLVTNRSVELDAQQRALSVSIAGVGRAAELSADGLGKYVTQLKQQGVAAEEAVKAVSSLARNSSLSSGAIGRIVGLGPDAAAALGVGVPEAMKQLADAAKGSVEAINKLDEAFNLLTPAQGASVRAMIEHGDKAGALETVFGKLEERVRGLDRDALSPMQRATRDLGNSWDGFIDAIARSETVIAAVERLGAAVRGLASFITPYSQTPAQQLATIDERLAAVSGEIPGTNASAARLRREQAEARAALLAQRSALAQQIADAAEAGGGIPPAYSNPSLVSPTAGRELAASAASRVSGSDAGRLTALRTETEKFREALAALDPAVSGNRALIDTYTQAIKANEKSIEDMNKKNEEHRTGLQKTADTYEVQIKAQKELTAAYGESRDAVQRVLAVQEAEQKVISEGLVKG